MSWTDGYMDEVGYTYGYYRELSPLLMEFAVLNRMQAARAGRPLRYLELGFGQGLSLNIHAAAFDGEFWGVDFNPAHAAHAQDLARASGSGARISDESFAELAARPDLPEFDVIALHGIWSWISDANRKIIVDLARRKLAPGGLLFMSYNVLPGWSATLPLRHLLSAHAGLADKATTGMLTRINNAIDFAQSLSESGALYFQSQPPAIEWLKTMKGQEGSYLAHEYFNADWHPMTFTDAARQLEESKLSFVASAHILDHMDELSLNPAQQALLASIAHPVLRQTTRDFCVNQMFRRDIWVKGPRPLSASQQIELLRSLHFVLIVRAEDVSLKVQGATVSATLAPEVFRPIADALASDGYAPKTLARLAELLPATGHPQLLQALLIFIGNDQASPAQSPEAARGARSRTDALNAHLIERAAFSGDIAFLASPVAGRGILVPRFEQLFLRAIRRGLPAPENWAADAWRYLSFGGMRLIKDGSSLNTDEENLAELTAQARVFADKRLAVLKALMVI